MHFTYLTILAAASSAMALPATAASSVSTAVPTFTAPGPVIFQNATCTLSTYLMQGQPLSNAFPAANKLGALAGPVLKAILGQATINSIDSVADQLCISAQQEPEDGDGICQDALQAIRDFVDAKFGQKKADKYNCLLDLLCITRTDPTHPGTCQTLLAGADCIANRLVSPTDKECTSDPGK